MHRLTSALIVALTLAACGESKRDRGPNSVEWQNYSSSAKERILEIVDNRDCRGMQRELDIAYNNRKSNNGAASLISFLDYSLEKSGCY